MHTACVCGGVHLVAKREAQREEGYPVLFPSDWMQIQAVLSPESPPGKGGFCTVPKHLRALLTEHFFWLLVSQLGEGAVSRAASLPPLLSPCAVHPLNHELFGEIPCPVHNRDAAVLSAPSLAL